MECETPNCRKEATKFGHIGKEPYRFCLEHYNKMIEMCLDDAEELGIEKIILLKKDDDKWRKTHIYAISAVVEWLKCLQAVDLNVNDAGVWYIIQILNGGIYNNVSSLHKR